MPRMCNDHVSLYSEETNAETNVVLVPYLYRIVPHIHSALFPTLYMGKRSAIEILLISKNPVSRMRGKHIPEGRRFSKQTNELILVG